jgi:hypothetical protein
MTSLFSFLARVAKLSSRRPFPERGREQEDKRMNIDLTDLATLIPKREEELRLHRGKIKCVFWRIRGWFVTGPRAEIAHEVQVVNSFAERAQQRFGRETGLTETDKANLVTVRALLKCARDETDFAQAWSHVNLADAILPLIVAEEDLLACVSRLKNADYRLPNEYQAELKEYLTDGEVVSLLKNLREWMEANKPKARGKDEAESKAHSELEDRVKRVIDGKTLIPSDPLTRQCRHAEQLVRTVLWNGVNRKVSLKLSLWGSIRRGLTFALLALFAAIAMWTSCQKIPDWKLALSFLEIAFLGLFGGMLSAFLKARDEEVNVPSYQVVVSRTRLRMLLGAAGAVVMYGVGLRLLTEKLQVLINTDLFAFLTVGIVGGFSERLFIETLEKAASNLHTSGSPTKKEGKSKASRPKAKEIVSDAAAKEEHL